jgi:chorismate mutase
MKAVTRVFTAFLRFWSIRMKLEESRKKIDAIDTEILILLNRRAEISREIGLLKAGAALPVADPRREVDILRCVIRENEGMIGDEAVAEIYRTILQESRRIQVEAQREVSITRQDVYK